MRVTFEEFSLTSQVLLAHDPLIVNGLMRRSENIGQRAARLERDLAVGKYNAVQAVQKQLATAAGSRETTRPLERFGAEKPAVVRRPACRQGLFRRRLERRSRDAGAADDRTLLLGSSGEQRLRPPQRHFAGDQSRDAELRDAAAARPAAGADSQFPRAEYPAWRKFRRSESPAASRLAKHPQCLSGERSGRTAPSANLGRLDSPGRP